MIINRIKQFGSRIAAWFSASEDGQPSWFRDKHSGFWFGGALSWTKSKQNVNHETARRVSTVYQCVRIIAEEGAMLPLKFYRDSEGGRKRVKDTTVEHLLKHPNPWQTEFEFREFMLGSLALRGNAYAQIVPGRSMLIPLHATRVFKTELLDDGRVAYHIRDKNGKEGILQQYEMLHFKLMSDDGVTGMSPIEYNLETIGLDMAARDHAATYWANASKPGGFITVKTPLTDDGYVRLQTDVDRFRDPANQNKTPVFSADLDWKQTGLSAKDSQQLENRKFSRAEIAAIFRVPLHMLNDLDGAKFNNMELQDLSLLKHTLMPYLVRIEQRIKHTLIYDDLSEEAGLFCEFLADGLLRGDSKTRSEVYRTSLGGPGTGRGWLSVNDIRRMENKPPLDDPRAEEVYLGENPDETGNGSSEPSNGGPSEADALVAQIRSQMETYAIGVRSGTITPTEEDEAYFRELMKLPGVADAVREVWKIEPTRRPVTLANDKKVTPVEDTETTTEDTENTEGSDPPPPVDDEETEDDSADQEVPDAIATGPFGPMIRDVTARLMKIERRNITRRAKYATEDPDRFRAWVEDYYQAHAVLAQSEMKYLADATECGDAVEHIAANYCIGRCEAVIQHYLHDNSADPFCHDSAITLLSEELPKWMPVKST